MLDLSCFSRVSVACHVAGGLTPGVTLKSEVWSEVAHVDLVLLTRMVVCMWHTDWVHW